MSFTGFLLGLLPVTCFLAGYWLGFRHGLDRGWRGAKDVWRPEVGK